MYFHDELKLLLVIYVDDLKLAGPSENLAKGWEMLRTVLRIEPETDLGLYLGCVLSQGETQLHNGKKVKTITYNMEGLLKLSVEKYLDIIGKDTKLKRYQLQAFQRKRKAAHIELLPMVSAKLSVLGVHIPSIQRCLFSTRLATHVLAKTVSH